MARYSVRVSGKEYDVKVESAGDIFSVNINKKNKKVAVQNLAGSRMLLLIDNQPSEVDIRSDGYDSRRLVFVKGTEVEVEIEDFRLAQAKKLAGMRSGGTAVKVIRAPMPGLILEVKVSPGERVQEQQPLVVIEAMKMENIIKSPRTAVIKKIFVTCGKSVEKNDQLIEFE
ncbi:MAG: biotin/lipoyl-containing protein [Candidatus Zixiibacteriota bacterium]